MRKILVPLCYLYLLSISAFNFPLPQPAGSPPRIVLFLMGPLWLIYTLHQRKIARYPLSIYAFFMFASWCGFSCFWTVDPELTFDSIYKLLTYVVPILIIYEFLQSNNRLTIGLAFFSAGSYAICAHTLYNFLNGIYASNIPDRYTGLYFDPNEVGIVLAIQSCVALYLVSSHPKILGNWKPFFSFLPMACLVASVMTGSRAAVAIWFVPVIYAMILFRSAPRRKEKIAVFAIVVLAVAVMSFSRQSLQKQFDRLSSITISYSADQLGGRLPLWKAGFDQFIERPVIGVGFGAYRTAIESSGAMPVGSKSPPAHNTFLSVLAETGLVGFLLFCSIFVMLYLNIRDLDKNTRMFWLTVFACWFIGSSAITFESSVLTWILFLLASLAGKVVPENSSQSTVIDTRAGTPKALVQPSESQA